MVEKEVQVEGKYNIHLAWVTYLPIMFLIGVVPLIVRLVRLERDAASSSVTGPEIIDDFFSQYKAIFILITAALMLFIFFLIIDKKFLKWDAQIKVYGIATLVYIGMTFLSSFFSEYRHLSLWGIGNRAEGAMVLGAYIVAMGYSFYLFQKKENYKYIILSLAFVTIIATCIAFTQYIGKDVLLSTTWGRKLIISDAYAEIRHMYVPLYESRRAYATMFHYNYVGSFTAMTFPVFTTLALAIRSVKKRMAYAVLALLSLGLLLMSTSRAGVMGIVASMLVLGLIFSRMIWRKKKLAITLVIVSVIGILGANIATKGILFERIPSLAQDAFALFLSAENQIDLKQNLPLQNITHEEREVVLHTKDHLLKVGYDEIEGISFKDESGEKVTFLQKEVGVYSTEEIRFNGFLFKNLQQTQSKEDWVLEIEGQRLFYFTSSQDMGMHLIDPLTEDLIEIEEVPAIGFAGKERLGSARGYIWSRSIPLLKKTMLLGYGPDTYVIQFPQRDYFGKWVAYDTPHMIVDKPHNLYLQIGLGQGVVALIAFVALVGVYSIESIKIYGFKSFYREEEVYGVASFLAVVGYLVAGIFNDSVVSVAPIFWVLLGVGIALNYLVRKQRRQEEKESPYRTIELKKARRKK
jgi:O-antigen ligase